MPAPRLPHSADSVSGSTSERPAPCSPSRPGFAPPARPGPIAGAVLAVALLGFSLLLAAPAQAGPPWISVEYPVNPHDRALRGALVMVHTYHHGTPRPFPLEAVARGRVDGESRSVELRVSPTGRPGVYAVHGEVPAEGAWILVLEMTDSDNGARAGALVALGPDREVTAVEVPAGERDGWTIPRAVTEAEVEAMLRTARALSRARKEVAVGASVPGSLGGLLLAGLGAVLPLGVAVRRRMRG